MLSASNWQPHQGLSELERVGNELLERDEKFGDSGEESRVRETLLGTRTDSVLGRNGLGFRLSATNRRVAFVFTFTFTFRITPAVFFA